MDILYTGLVGTTNDPEQMKRVFNDDGLQKSSIMTLYYVQVAADIEAPDLRLSLPKDSQTDGEKTKIMDILKKVIS